MKKDYEAPKAEKVNFQYSEVVVASVGGCYNETTLRDLNAQSTNCRTTEVIHTVYDNGI